MLTKLAALTILPTLLVGGVVMNASVMLVDVNEGHGGMHLVIPVPLSLAQMALAFAPDEAKRVAIPEEAGRFFPYLDRIVAELENAPNALLVEVVDGGDHVTIYKEDGVLRIEVDESGDAHVRVNVPLAAVRAIVAAYDADSGYLHTSRVVGALRSAPSGELVHVIDGDEEVLIRMW